MPEQVGQGVVLVTSPVLAASTPTVTWNAPPVVEIAGARVRADELGETGRGCSGAGVGSK